MGLKDDFEALEHAAKAVQKDSRKHEQTVAQQRHKLAERIKAGETTGDPIMDYALAHWYGSHDQVSAKLQAIKSELQGKTGQLMLVVEDQNTDQSPQPSGFVASPFKDASPGGLIGNPFSMGFNSDSQTLYLGVLERDTIELDIQYGDIRLPVMSFSSYSENDRRCVILKSNLPFSWQKDESIPLYLPYMSKSIDVLAGDEKVFSWFKKSSPLMFQEDLLLRMLLPLGDKLNSLPDMAARLKAIAAELEQEFRVRTEQINACHNRLIDVSQALRDPLILELAQNIRSGIQELTRLKKRAETFGLIHLIPVPQLKINE